MRERAVRLRAARAGILAGLLLTSPVAASPLQHSPEAYSADLRRLASSLTTATPEEATGIARGVPAVWVIEHDGQRFEVPAVWLRRELNTIDPKWWPRTRSRLAERLKAMAAEGERLVQVAPARDSAAARAALDRVLAGPEFRRLRAESALDALRARVSETLLRWWQRLRGSGVASRDLAVVLAWTASLAALALLTAWLIRTVRRSTLGSPMYVPGSGALTLSARAWAKQARAAADPREVARCAYRAAVRRLEEEGAWRADAARTPREYRRLLPATHARRPAVQDVTARFEEIWYGARPATEDDRRMLLSRLVELECLPAE